MKNLSYLKRQLYEIKKEYYDLLEEENKLKNQKDILEEIVNIINRKNIFEMLDNIVLLDIQLSEIYKDSDIQETLHITLNNVKQYESNREYYENELVKELHKLNKIIKKINMDLENISVQYQNIHAKTTKNKEMVNKYNNLLRNLKLERLINSYQLDLIQEFMDQNEYSDKEQILTLEEVRYHNKKIKTENYNRTQTEIAQILNKKFYLFVEPDYEDKILDNEVVSLYDTINKIEDMDEIDDYLPELETGLYTIEKYNYIYPKLINKIIMDLMNCQEELTVKENYQDIEMRNMYVEEFFRLNKYLGKLSSLYKMQVQDYKEQDVVVEPLIEEDARNIYFSYPLGNKESYMEKDASKLPEETLGEVKDLLERFKKDKLSSKELKPFNSNNKPLISYKELRGDQIRIVFKCICDNNYIFVGVGQKKDDNDINFYKACANRNIDIDLEKLQTTEKEKADATYQTLIEYIENNKRKGNRY